jgi:hypothetical protein
VARKHFGPVGRCFFDEMRRALPDMPDDEMAWRTSFAIGAMAHALTALGAGSGRPSDVARRMVAFLSGGFRAPVAAREKVEVK